MTRSGTADTIRHRTWGELMPPATRWQFAILAALILLAYRVPIERDLVTRWLHDGNWSHGWLVPVFSLYFLITRREQLMRVVPRPNYLGAAAIILSLLVYLVGVGYGFAYLEPLSLIGVLAGTTLLMGGWPVMRIAWFPIFYLLLAIPLPQHYFVMLTRPMREIATFIAVMMIPLFAPGIEIEAQDVIIDFHYVALGTQGSLNVEEACSGMRLMMAFAALGVAMAYLDVSRPTWQRLVMVLSCIPIAIACNAIRVTVTGLLQVYGRGDLAEGTPHQLLGIAMLLIAFGLFALIGHALSHLLVETDEAEDEAGRQPL